MNNNEKSFDLACAILGSAKKQLLKKAVFSKSADKSIVRTTITLKNISGKLCMQAESLHTDNKAKHENIYVDQADAIEMLVALISSFAQVNLITTVGDCEYKVSKSGKKTLIGLANLTKKIELSENDAEKVEISDNNNKKNYIIDGSAPFLKYLGVSDQSGRIHDKKQSKFRQINKFVENIRDIYSHLPKEGELVICDLCCGKSYLSFAAYHYLANILGRKVKMYGVDLKQDVIEYCNDVAKAVGFDGLEFFCGDITAYKLEAAPHLVISLHACDTATDVVIEKAIAERALVVLSTPCCHHELNHTLNCPALSFVAEHSMLRQKLCDAATDALRLKLLEANGYSVSAVELIDPEQTPKNILLRAIKKPDTPANRIRAKAAAQEYENAKKFLLGL